jgi:hypothetical protein
MLEQDIEDVNKEQTSNKNGIMSAFHFAVACWLGWRCWWIFKLLYEVFFHYTSQHSLHTLSSEHLSMILVLVLSALFKLVRVNLLATKINILTGRYLGLGLFYRASHSFLSDA